MHDDFPEWLLHSDAPPPEVRGKLAAMLATRDAAPVVVPIRRKAGSE